MIINKYRKFLWLYIFITSLIIVSFYVSAEESSKVLQFKIPKMLEEKYDVLIKLYHRDGKFNMGYAVVPERDNTVHGVDVTPSPAIAFLDENGKKLVVPKSASHYYSYHSSNKDPFYKNSRTAFYEGKLSIAHTSKVPPIKWQGEELLGLIDLKINRLNDVNGMAAKYSHALYRVDIKAALKDGILNGKATAWQYKDKDPDYGKDSKKISYDITGKLNTGHWQAKPGTDYDKDKTWPMAHGPNLTGAAIDCDTPLVDSLRDARLLWVADMPLGAGRGGGLMRGNFCMYPINWTVSHEGGFGGPIMADNKVFVYAPSRDIEALAKDPDINKNPYYRLGADPGLITIKRKVPPKNKMTEFHRHRDSLFAFDARSGKILWQYHGEPGSAQGYGGKGGRASTPCYYKNKVYIRAGNSVICLDANTGKQVWVNKDYGLNSATSDASLTMVGGSLILTHAISGGWATVGLSPKDGKKVWSIDYAGGGGDDHSWPGTGIPGLYRENGKEYLVLGRNSPLKKRKDTTTFLPPENFLMLDPSDGKILWESDALSYNDGQIVVIGDMAIGNYAKGDPKLKNAQMGHRIAGVKISTKGAKLLWKSDVVHPSAYRQYSIANHGVYYSDSRVSGFTATDIATGKLLKKYSEVYKYSKVSHNWSWQIASNDRVFTEGILMFKMKDNIFSKSSHRLANPVAGGYLSATKPAIADGRLIFRMDDKLVCFDLRKAN